MRTQKAFLLALLTLSPLMAQACDGVWSSSTGFTNWNNPANWTPCIPGAAGSTATDTATFPTTALTLHDITLDINPGLSSMTFNSASTAYVIAGGPGQLFFNTASPSINILSGSHAIEAFSKVASGATLGINLADFLSWEQGAVGNPAGPFNINYTGPGELNFEWNGGGVFAASTINLGGGNLAINNGLFLLSNDIFPHPGAPHGSAIDNANQIVITNGTLTVKNLAPISFDAAPRVTGASLKASQVIVGSGSSLNLENTNTITGTTHPDFGSYVELGSLTSQGSITLNNTGSAQSGGVGNHLLINPGPLILSGGSLSIQNTGSITTAGTGNLLFLEGSLQANNTTISVHNAGSVNGGLATGSTVVIQQPSVFTNSSFTMANDAPAVVTNTAGTLLLAPTTSVDTGTTFNATNAGPVISLGVNAVGATMGFDHLTLNGGTFNLNNSGTVFSPTIAGFRGVGTGVVIDFDLVINSGSLICQNSGNVGADSFGTLIEIDQNLIMTGGLLLNNGTGSGSFIVVDGSSQINGGLLNNNGIFMTPSLTMGTAGTVSGTGLFTNPGGIHFVNNGTLKPGSPTGTMTIEGTYQQSSTAFFVASFASPTAFSQLNVTGAAQLSGTLRTDVVRGGSISGTKKYPIITATGGVLGQFNTVLSNSILQPNVEYLPNSVLVSFTLPVPQYPNYAEPLFSTINHINGRLERRMSKLRNHFASLEIEEECVEEEVVVAEELLADNNPELAAVEQKQQQLQRRLDRDKDKDQDNDQGSDPNLYLGPKGDVGRVLTHKKNPGFHYTDIGAEAGFDYVFSRLGIGFLADYDHLHGRGDHHWGKFDVDQTHGSLYATYIRRAERRLSFNLILGGGYDWYHIHRRTPAGVARAHPQGLEYDALAGMEYTFGEACEWQIVPLVNLQYIYLHVNKYREKGAPGFNLAFHSQNVRSLRSMAGVRMNRSWRWTDFSFTPEINLGWQWEFFDKQRHLGINFIGVSNQITIFQPGRNIATAGIDFLFELYDKYGIEASYDFEWNTRYMDHFFYIGCNFRF